MSIKIDKQLLTINKYSRPGSKRNKTTKIAWHYIGNPNTSAKANRNYFNNLAKTHATYASSHYIVGLEGEIIQCVPEDEIAYTTNSANSYSISIEVCHPDNTGKFNKVSEDALIELTAMLCKKYGLGSRDIIRHYDITKKMCPLYYVKNVEAYNNARNRVQSILNGSNKGTVENKNYCILYSNEADRVGAEVLSWGVPNSTVLDIKDYRSGYWGVIAVGGKTEIELKAKYPNINFTTIKGADRYETVNKCMKYLNKL